MVLLTFGKKSIILIFHAFLSTPILPNWKCYQCYHVISQKQGSGVVVRIYVCLLGHRIQAVLELLLML